jgi:hypothetical protein
VSVLADIFGSVRLNLDTGEFEVAAAKAADKTGASMGQRMSGKLGKALAGGIGAGIGLAFASASQGALEINAAMAEFTAQTGASDAQAKEFEKTLAGLNKANVQGIPEISNTLIALKQHFNLAGKEAEAAASAFLDYSRVVGTDAATAAGSFDELVDAGVISVEQMIPFMDQLAASHQKYGVSIQDTTAALVKFAPAMTAFGISTNDALAYINLFSEMGLNAETSTKAFNLALTKVKSPDELKRLVADISNTEDPFLRAQKASDLFGKRAGVQLANALKPGSGGIEAWGMTAEEAAGTVTTLGDALDNSLGNKAKLILKQLSGALAEAGTSMGDLLMIAAVMGPGMTKAIVGGLGGLAGVLTKSLIPKVSAAILATGPGASLAASGVGTAAGTAMGAAIPIALVAAAGVGIALAFKSMVLDPGLQQQSRDIGTAVGKQIATGATDELEISKKAIEQGITDINNLPLGGFLYGDQVRDLTTQLDAVNAEIAARAAKGGETVGAAATEGVATGIETAAPVVEIAADKVVATFGTNMAGVKAAMGKVGFEGMSALAQGITAARQAPLDAFTSLKDMLKNAMTPQAEQLRLHGQLLSKTLAAGLRSGDPAVRAQAQATAQAIANRLAELSQSGGKAGRESMKALNAGIRSKIPEVRAASLAAKKALDEKLAAAKGSASTAGKNAGAAFSSGVASGVGSTGFKFNGSFSFRGGMKALASGGPITAPSWVGEDGPEVYVPERAGRILSHEDAMAAVSAGAAGGRSAGGPITVNVYNPAPEPASTSTRRELRKLALSGSAA